MRKSRGNPETRAREDRCAGEQKGKRRAEKSTERKQNEEDKGINEKDGKRSWTKAESIYT